MKEIKTDNTHEIKCAIRNDNDPIDKIREAKRNVAIGVDNGNSYKEYIRTLNMI